MKHDLLALDKDKNSLTINGGTVTDYIIDYKKEGKDELIYRKSDKPKEFSNYILNQNLVNAVNAAIITGRPLYLKGEPGCGKTKLAFAVAYKLLNEDACKFYFEWHIKSTSKASEGGYVFDQVARLRDATISSKDPLALARVKDPKAYIKLGPLGKSFLSEPKEGKKSVILIDEIDKGNIDFPNDLLLELDEMRFKINELDNTYINANERPLVFITSNDERKLPAAFLRRCLFYEIPSLSEDTLIEILSGKLNEIYEDWSVENKAQILKSDHLEKIKNNYISIKESAGNKGQKKPSTSELLDWLKLIVFKVQIEKLPFEEVIEDSIVRNMTLKISN